MLTKEIMEFNYTGINNTISIAKYTVVYDNEIEIARSSPHRCAFAPGDIERVKQYLGVDTGPEIDYLTSVWTDDAINTYNASITE